MKIIDTKTARRIARYADTIGVLPEVIVTRVVNEWLDRDGGYIAQQMTQRRKTPVEESSFDQRLTEAGKIHASALGIRL